MTMPAWFCWWRGTEVDEDRWIVLDVETSGLNAQEDDLLCIAGMALHRQQHGWVLAFEDSFETVVRPAVIRAAAENVLLHRIGWAAQDQGTPQNQALHALQAWLGRSPVIAFHAAFDRAFLTQAFQREHMRLPSWSWLDVAEVLPLAFPDVAAHALDEWMENLQIRCVKRHQAAADVWATAQLWLMVAARLSGQNHMTWQRWQQTARQGRWLGRTRVRL